MTHEFKNIVKEAISAKSEGLRSVLASVVALDGSSYRRPGVRMLILENGHMVGAVSGGCVEKEILLQSESVFKTGASKMMTYDGRYRLGCEGVLYILLEVFQPLEKFETTFFKCLKDRRNFDVQAYFKKQEGIFEGIGSSVIIGTDVFSISGLTVGNVSDALSVFKQTMPPCFKLIIIGAEHDAVQLCQYAALTGWEVTIIAAVSESKSMDDFPGATAFYALTAEHMDTKHIDAQTAIVLMTHNFANDLRYLVALKDSTPAYIGLLGPGRRRDDLLSQFIEYSPDVKDSFLECIHGPAGLNIGAETPQEIAISVISEILTTIRRREPMSLSKRSGRIHV